MQKLLVVQENKPACGFAAAAAIPEQDNGHIVVIRLYSYVWRVACALWGLAVYLVKALEMLKKS